MDIRSCAEQMGNGDSNNLNAELDVGRMVPKL